MTLLSIYFSHNENKYITLPINTVPVDSDFFLFVAGIYTGIGGGGVSMMFIISPELLFFVSNNSVFFVPCSLSKYNKYEPF